MWVQLKAFAGVLLAQGVVAVAGAVTGLLIVRALPPEHYAAYALAFAVLGALNLLGDSGTSTAALSQGGKVWRDPVLLGAVLRGAGRLRNRLALAFGPAGLVVLAFLLHRNGVGGAEIAAWCGVVGLLFAINLRAALLEVPLKLHQSLRATQGVAVGQVLLRLAAVVATVAVWPVAMLAALANGLPQAWANWRLRRAGAGLAESPGAEPSPEVRAEIRRVVGRSLPGGVYYILCQHAGYAILGFTGSTLAVAQLGALSRIGLLIGVVAALCGATLVPRFARLEDGAGLGRAYWRGIAVAAALCLPLLAAGWVAPSALLWLVGPAYAGLETALLLAVAGSALQVVGSVSMQLVHARGWLPPPALAIACSLTVQLASWRLLDLRTLEGILIMMLALGVQQIALHVLYFEFRRRRA